MLRLTLLACLSCLGSQALADDRSPPTIRFNRDVRSILSDRCFACHGPDAAHRQADLRLDVEGSTAQFRGGSEVIVPGKPADSELWHRITSLDPAVRMPPPETGKELSPAEIDTLSRWIAQGGAYEVHWSLMPLVRPPVPSVAADVSKLDAGSAAIDAFILRELELQGLSPSPEADPVTLIRRLSFDLRGLPPSVEEVELFLAEPTDETYQFLVDRYLDSTHYAERMAVYWLDLVRFSDTVGYHGDQDHHIAPYRDYVINAFLVNMPFDQFTIEQLAGDLLEEPTTDQLIATGYNRVLQTSHEGGVQPGEYLVKYAADRVRNLGAVWMGVTLGCCECHDHKYDPYSQRDFYSLAAFFADIDEERTFRGTDSVPTRREPEMDVLSPLIRREIEQLQRQIAAIESATDETDAASHDLPDDAPDLPALRRRLERLEGRYQRTMITQAVEPRTIRILPRGNWLDHSGPIVEPDTPESLPPLEVSDRRKNRLDLARWLVSGEQPQTARVFVNRLWYLFFGEGLSRSLDDTGNQGEWPSHPELLDWLAVEFQEEWDVKHLVRRLVLSRTYRQSSLPTAEQQVRDPLNRYLSRQNRWRLPAEFIRDQALLVSGLLVDELGGDLVRPYQPEGYYAELNFPQRTYVASRDRQQYRRGVYMHWQRTFLHPMLRAFDAPTREECTARRASTNTPAAALVLLNDPTFVEAARCLAARVLREGGEDDAARIGWLWKAVLSREPDTFEHSTLESLLHDARRRVEEDPQSATEILSVGFAPISDDLSQPELAAWTTLCRVMLNLGEGILRD